MAVRNPRAQRALAGAAAVLAPLAFCVQFGWTLADPLDSWTSRWATGAWALMVCEFIVLHGVLTANSMSGTPRARRHSAAALALLYGVVLLFVWIRTLDTVVVAGAGVMLLRQIAGALEGEAAAREHRQEVSFRAALAFVVVLALFMLPWPIPAFGFTPEAIAQLGAGELRLAEPQRVVAFATVYFFLVALIEALNLRHPPPAPLPPGSKRLGAPGALLRIIPGGIEIEAHGSWHRMHPGLQLGAVLVALGILVATGVRPGAGTGFGLLCALFGSAVLVFCVDKATRSLGLTVRKGEVRWREKSLFSNPRDRTVPLAKVRNPVARPTLTMAASRGADARNTHLRFALVLNLDGAEALLDGFPERGEVDALGQLFAAALKYGLDEKSRHALSGSTFAVLWRQPPAPVDG